MYTTLNAIREHQPCKYGWEKLLKHLGKTSPDDEPLSLLTILESNGLGHALWCLCAVDGFEKEKLLLDIGFAREVERWMPDESKKSLHVFERYANGLVTQDEFETARETARAAARGAAAHASWAACAAWAAADAAANAADAATAADYAAWAAARAAAAAVRAAVRAADAAAWAAYAAAYSTIRAKQEAQLRELLERTCIQL